MDCIFPFNLSSKMQFRLLIAQHLVRMHFFFILIFALIRFFSTVRTLHSKWKAKQSEEHYLLIKFCIHLWQFQSHSDSLLSVLFHCSFVALMLAQLLRTRKQNLIRYFHHFYRRVLLFKPTKLRLHHAQKIVTYVCDSIFVSVFFVTFSLSLRFYAFMFYVLHFIASVG